MLRRVHGTGRAQPARVDPDAMFIWSQMHGLAALSQADVMPHLGLSPTVTQGMAPHAMHMLGLALDAAHDPEGP